MRWTWDRNKTLLVLLGSIFFLPFLGYIHLFDWDEINFAESAREMIQTGDYFRVRINYEPFWEKPPFFFWLQVISMKIFGINEFAARFPNAIFGIITLVILYSIGKKLFNPRFGMIWAFLYFSSFLSHMYFKSGIIDPIFNFFIFLGCYYLLLSIQSNKSRNRLAITAGFFIGMAVITKGPVGLLILILTFISYLIIKKFKIKIQFQQVIFFAVTILLTTLIWYGYETYNHGIWFLVEFIKYQIELFSEPVAGHQQPIYYHFLVVFIGCFPMSIFALPSFGKNKFDDKFDMRLWMKTLFWVVMILFTIVSTKIVHYSSMAYLPLSYLAANYLYSLQENKVNLKKYILWLLYIIGGLFAFLLIILPIIAVYKDLLIPFIKDKFAVAMFNQNVNWIGFEFLIGFIFLIGLFYFIQKIKKDEIYSGLRIFAISVGTTLMLYLVFVVSKIENYSQRPAITFYEELQNKDVYVTTIGFKSYAHYFYSRLKPYSEKDGIYQVKSEYYSSLSEDEKVNMNDLNGKLNEWLLHGEIDKPTYFVTKITNREFMSEQTTIVKIKTEGGFDFYQRK